MSRDGRLVKGVVVGIAGIALLVGGGTFALWYDTEDLPAGNVQSGQLDLALSGTGTWANQAGAIADISAYRIVPGDVLTLTQGVAINAVGDTLEAVLSVDTSAIAGTSELADALAVTTTVGTPPAGVVANGDGTFTITGATFTSPSTFPVAVTITFPQTTDGAPPAADRSNWWGQTAQADVVDLTTISFDLAQVVA